MKEYKFKNATIFVIGEVDRERFKNATVKFVKKSYKIKSLKVIENGNDNSSRDFGKE